MLNSPFGTIRVLFDGREIDCQWKQIPARQPFPDVDGAWLLEYPWENDGLAHELSCLFAGDFCEYGPESGEDLEAVAIYSANGKLTIGCEADFSKVSRMDFGGSCTGQGIKLDIRPDTKSRIFRFGAAWLNECTDETDIQTWFAADPTINA